MLFRLPPTNPSQQVNHHKAPGYSLPISTHLKILRDNPRGLVVAREGNALCYQRSVLAFLMGWRLAQPLAVHLARHFPEPVLVRFASAATELATRRKAGFGWKCFHVEHRYFPEYGSGDRLPGSGYISGGQSSAATARCS